MSLALRRYFAEIMGPGPTRFCDLDDTARWRVAPPAPLGNHGLGALIEEIVAEAIADAERADDEDQG